MLICLLVVVKLFTTILQLEENGQATLSSQFMAILLWAGSITIAVLQSLLKIAKRFRKDKLEVFLGDMKKQILINWTSSCSLLKLPMLW
jgi:hypothetical protein